MLGDHRQLNITGARREVDDQYVSVAPVGIDKLVECIARHRPAPRDGLCRFYKMPDRQHRNAEFRGHRLELLVFCSRAHPFGRHQLGLRRAVDVGIDQADFHAHPRQGNGEIGRQRRFADSAFAAADRDEATARALGGERDTDGLDTGNSH